MLSTETVSSFLVKNDLGFSYCRCPSFKFLTMQMQPSASCARMWTVLSVTTMFADKPHRLNERTSAQRILCFDDLASGYRTRGWATAQRAIAQRFRAMALFGRPAGPQECLPFGKSGRRDCVTRLPSLTSKHIATMRTVA